MKFTSIAHCQRSNFQVDYSGDREKCIRQFETWCRTFGALWAKLFEEETGERVHTFKVVD